ncbi:hypothetical protein EXIGLDRAFT_762875 [Exidia glandulosa HHB12029]|uniref:Uncharacterized protein n=1 Tax=Exidia glandulosa HHB12029 TaxID=1314781 RepID=A0A165MDG7_EXIGL|nr:hypothetical protein EXIGLDRAFT_762875 [Exidia glandulosa HHB12029]
MHRPRYPSQTSYAAAQAASARSGSSGYSAATQQSAGTGYASFAGISSFNQSDYFAHASRRSASPPPASPTESSASSSDRTRKSSIGSRLLKRPSRQVVNDVEVTKQVLRKMRSDPRISSSKRAPAPEPPLPPMPYREKRSKIPDHLFPPPPDVVQANHVAIPRGSRIACCTSADGFDTDVPAAGGIHVQTEVHVYSSTAPAARVPTYNPAAASRPQYPAPASRAPQGPYPPAYPGAPAAQFHGQAAYPRQIIDHDSVCAFQRATEYHRHQYSRVSGYEGVLDTSDSFSERPSSTWWTARLRAVHSVPDWDATDSATGVFAFGNFIIRHWLHVLHHIPYRIATVVASVAHNRYVGTFVGNASGYTRNFVPSAANRVIRQLYQRKPIVYNCRFGSYESPFPVQQTREAAYSLEQYGDLAARFLRKD